MTQFTDEHDMFRVTVRNLFDKRVVPEVDGREASGRFPAHKLFPDLAKVGLLRLEYAPEYGGEGADHWFTVIACRPPSLQRGADGVRRSSQCGDTVVARARQRHVEERISRAGNRRRASLFHRCTEPDAGSDVAGIRTRAIRDGDDWLISGAKTYITNGIQADWLCLLLRTSDEGGYRGMSQVIVPTDTPGVTVSRSLSKLGNWCSDTAEFAFDNARVPVTNTIGEIGRGFQQQMEQFQTERICAVYQAVIQRLHEALDHEGEALADPLTCGRAHSEFHVLLVELSSSNTLALFARITADITTAHTNAVLEDAGGDDGQARIDAELAHRVHQKVAHLIEERDGAAAEAMWRAHMAETAEKMLKTQGAREVLDLIS